MDKLTISAQNEDLARIIGDAITRKNGADDDELFGFHDGRHEVVQEILDALAAAGWRLMPPKRRIRGR
jgi:hypothetical protein